jgi:hypothetical protein
MKVKCLHNIVFGEKANLYMRNFTLAFAIFGFLLHLILWFLHTSEIFIFPESASHLLGSPLFALYTPFSILLGYEVYEIIKAIPSSFSTAVGKQYEVATLLVVRDVLKRLTGVEFSSDWNITGDLGLVLLECSAFLILFYTALNYQDSGTNLKSGAWSESSLSRFVTGKKIIALMLMATFVVITGLAFVGWLTMTIDGQVSVGRDIFFSDFFTCLILADILILLISYSLAHDFYSLVRNTGFVLSTVLLWVAITAPGASGIILFITSALIGIVILKISQYYNLKGVKND